MFEDIKVRKTHCIGERWAAWLGARLDQVENERERFARRLNDRVSVLSIDIRSEGDQQVDHLDVPLGCGDGDGGRLRVVHGGTTIGQETDEVRVFILNRDVEWPLGIGISQWDLWIGTLGHKLLDRSRIT